MLTPQCSGPYSWPVTRVCRRVTRHLLVTTTLTRSLQPPAAYWALDAPWWRAHGCSLSEYSMNKPSPTRLQQAGARRAQLIDTALEVFAARASRATVKGPLRRRRRPGPRQSRLPLEGRAAAGPPRAALFLPEIRRITSADRDRPAAEVLLEVAGGLPGCWTRTASSFSSCCARRGRTR